VTAQAHPLQRVGLRGMFSMTTTMPQRRKLSFSSLDEVVADAEKIRGLRTEQVAEVLGTLPYEEMVHRDNLVVLE